MANTLSVIDMVTRESLRILHEKLTFLGTINRSYDDSFAKGGAKIGSTLRVRNPVQFSRRKGSRVMDVQDITESTQTITVATQDGVDIKMNGFEETMSIDEITARYIEPAVAVLASGIEADVLCDLTKDVYHQTSTALTSSDITGLTEARAKINQQLAPKDNNRYTQIDSVKMGLITTRLNTLFHPGDQVAEAFREGYVTRTALATFYENERTLTHTNGDDVAGAIDESAETNFVQGTTTFHMDALGTSVTEGSVFTIDGVYDVHPETKQVYSHLKQFVVVGTPTIGSNEGDVTFSPAIYTTGPRQNVYSAAAFTAAGWNNKVTTFAGSASTAYRTNLMYHKDFATIVTADLPLRGDAASCVRRVSDGLAIRVWQASDIRNDEMLMRLDILYGWKILRPEWACRII